MKFDRLTSDQLEQLSSLSTCVVASSIETYAVRLRNTGFTDSSIRCFFEHLPPIVGYAATIQVRTSEPPMGRQSYYMHPEWWNYLLTVPPPRIVVMKDMDEVPGFGAFVGEVHANILPALGCKGLVTNGAVRDLGAVPAGFQIFAHNVSVSHAYAHIVDFGETVEIAGLTVKPGDLIHGDRHGLVTIPREIARQIPMTAQGIVQRRQSLTRLCHSADFNIETLREAIADSGY